MIMMRAPAILFVVACLAVGNGSRAADSVAPVPVLVELFTSEGCSSCPPADAWLQQIDAVQPVPGARLIVLSEHVDYWNHDGWKDPYSSSSSSITERQGDYVRALRLESPATPQVVVDGTVNLPLNDAQQIRQTLQQAATTPMVPVRIVSAAVDPGNSAVLRAHIEVDGTSAPHNADIFGAVALGHAESQVLHGENSGKHLAHTAVLQSLTKIGKLEKGKNFSREVEIKLKSGTDPKNVRLIVFAQESGPGRVLGAALQEAMN
jgi:hypothetical protein